MAININNSPKKPKEQNTSKGNISETSISGDPIYEKKRSSDSSSLPSPEKSPTAALSNSSVSPTDDWKARLCEHLDRESTNSSNGVGNVTSSNVVLPTYGRQNDPSNVVRAVKVNPNSGLAVAGIPAEEAAIVAEIMATTLAGGNIDSLAQSVGDRLQSQAARKAVALEFAKLGEKKVAQCFLSFGIEVQADRLEVALACAQNYPAGTAKHFANFGLSDQADIKRVALECARRDSVGIIPHFRNFGLRSTADIKEIVIACATDNFAATAHNFPAFGLQEQSDIKDVLIALAKINPVKVAKYFASFGLTDAEAVAEFADALSVKQAPALGDASTSPALPSLDATRATSKLSELTRRLERGGVKAVTQTMIAELETQQDRKALVLFALQKNPQETMRDFAKFGLSDQAMIKEIALTCAEKDPVFTAFYCANFGLSNQDAIKDVALACVRRDGYRTARNFKYLGLKDAADRREVAIVCASHYAPNIIKNFENFELKKESDIVAVLLPLAKTCGGTVAAHIDNFRLSDQAVLKQIAIACARQDAHLTSFYFHKFGLKSQEDIKEVALVCAEENGGSTAEYFKNFGLKSQEDIKEVALACAKRDGQRTAQNFRNFGLESQTDIKEVALACAAQDGGGTAKFCSCFGLSAQEDIKSVALACAKQDVAGATEHFGGFGLVDQADIAAVAMECMCGSPIRTIYNFHYFDIIDQREIVRIVSVALDKCKDNPTLIMEFAKFSLKDQENIRKIALAYAHSPNLCSSLMKCFDNLGLSHQGYIKEVALACVELNCAAVITNFSNLGLKDQAAIKEVALACARKEKKITAEKFLTFGLSEQTAVQEVAIVCDEAAAETTGAAADIEARAQSALRKLALACIADNPQVAVERFASFGLKEQRAVKEVALLCARYGYGVKQFRNFGLTEQRDIKEVAMAYAESNALQLAENFQSFGITAQADIKEVAMACVKTAGARIFQRFANFGLTESSSIKEVALAIVAGNHAKAFNIPENFSVFGLSDPLDIREVALACAKSDPAGTVVHFKQFGFTEQSVIKEVALACSCNHTDVKVMIENFENLGLKEQVDCKDVILVWARKCPAKIAQHIGKFAKVDQTAAKEIALEISRYDAAAVAEHCRQFRLSAESDRKEIALACVKAATDPADLRCVLESFANFDITDQAFIGELALACAKQNAHLTARFFKCFGLIEPFAVKAVALYCAEKVSINTILFFGGFGLSDQNTIKEVVCVCARQNAGEVIQFFPNLQLKDQTIIKEVALICAEEEPQQSVEHFDNFGISDMQCGQEFAYHCLKNLSGSILQTIEGNTLEEVAAVHAQWGNVAAVKLACAFMPAAKREPLVRTLCQCGKQEEVCKNAAYFVFPPYEGKRALGQVGFTDYSIVGGLLSQTPRAVQDEKFFANVWAILNTASTDEADKRTQIVSRFETGALCFGYKTMLQYISAADVPRHVIVEKMPVLVDFCQKLENPSNYSAGVSTASVKERFGAILLEVAGDLNNYRVGSSYELLNALVSDGVWTPKELLEFVTEHKALAQDKVLQARVRRCQDPAILLSSRQELIDYLTLCNGIRKRTQELEQIAEMRVKGSEAQANLACLALSSLGRFSSNLELMLKHDFRGQEKLMSALVEADPFFKELDLKGLAIGSQAYVKLLILEHIIREGNVDAKFRHELETEVIPGLSRAEAMTKDFPTLGMEFQISLDGQNRDIAALQVLLVNWLSDVQLEHGMGQSGFTADGYQLRMPPTVYPVFILLVGRLQKLLKEEGHRTFDQPQPYLTCVAGNYHGEATLLLTALFHCYLPEVINVAVPEYSPEELKQLGVFPSVGDRFVGATVDPWTGKLLDEGDTRTQGTQTNLFASLLGSHLIAAGDRSISVDADVSSHLEQTFFLVAAAAAYSGGYGINDSKLAGIYQRFKETSRRIFIEARLDASEVNILLGGLQDNELGNSTKATIAALRSLNAAFDASAKQRDKAKQLVGDAANPNLRQEFQRAVATAIGETKQHLFTSGSVKAQELGYLQANDWHSLVDPVQYIKVVKDEYRSAVDRAEAFAALQRFAPNEEEALIAELSRRVFDRDSEARRVLRDIGKGSIVDSLEAIERRSRTQGEHLDERSGATP